LTSDDTVKGTVARVTHRHFSVVGRRLDSVTDSTALQQSEKILDNYVHNN